MGATRLLKALVHLRDHRLRLKKCALSLKSAFFQRKEMHSHTYHSVLLRQSPDHGRLQVLEHRCFNLLAEAGMYL
jgi:hypothetical protein